MHHCYRCNLPVFDGPASYAGPQCKCFFASRLAPNKTAEMPWVPYREQELVPSAELAALRIEAKRLRAALEHVVLVMGPKTPPCCAGCETEWTEALRTAREAVGAA